MQVFKAWLVEETTENTYTSSLVERSLADLPPGEVVVKVQYSSINYKDALSNSGNKGVTREYPHTPGIDAAGTVVESSSAVFKPGDEVIVTGFDLGMNTSGGFGQLIRIPAEWLVKCPQSLSLKESMIIGTAGFTAALCIEKLMKNGVSPDAGEILVTGASGGVGIVAVALLKKLGFTVVASTGKSEQHDLLTAIGAEKIIDRGELSEESSRPMLKEQWAGAVDVVGGVTLANILKTLRYGGSVACCGLVGSPTFPATVFPFILRGINLLGVDSVMLPQTTKQQMWNKLATDWRLDNLSQMSHEIGFDSLQSSLEKVLSGQGVGRTVLNLQS